MDTVDREFTINLILGEIQGLIEGEKEFSENKNALDSFNEDWWDSLIRLSSIWNEISINQQNLIRQKFLQVKLLINRFGLSWPEELGE